MNLDLKQIVPKFKQLLAKVQKYSGFTFLISILLIYTFLVFRVSVLSSAEPDEDVVLEQSNSIKRLKIDQNSVDRIEELEDQNIGVQSLFESARDNPFGE